MDKETEMEKRTNAMKRARVQKGAIAMKGTTKRARVLEGVHFYSGSKRRYRVGILIDNTVRYLGSYSTQHEAYAAYDKAKNERESERDITE